MPLLPRKRWLRLSLLHPAASALLCLVALVPRTHTPLDVMLHLSALVFFIINIPGVALLQDISGWINWDAHQIPSFIFMVFTTWLLVVLPACVLIIRIRQRKAPAKGNLGAASPTL